MYTVEPSAHGFTITIGDKVTSEDATLVLEQSRAVLEDCAKPFGVLVDIRSLRPLPREVERLIDQTQRLFRENGLRRSAVVLASATLTMQFRRMAAESGVAAGERFIDASQDPQWHRTALAWIVDGVEPVGRFSTMASTMADFLHDAGGHAAGREVP